MILRAMYIIVFAIKHYKSMSSFAVAALHTPFMPAVSKAKAGERIYIRRLSNNNMFYYPLSHAYPAEKSLAFISFTGEEEGRRLGWLC